METFPRQLGSHNVQLLPTDVAQDLKPLDRGMLAPDSYRPLDPTLDWPLFDPDFGCSAEDRATVLPLTEIASSAVWNTHVSAKQMERHPMLLPSGHWLHPTIFGPDWITEFNGDSEALNTPHGTVAAFLRQCFELSNDAQVFFIAMRERSYLMPF